MAMIIGAVRWFDVPKGYGFIKPDDGGVDVLVDICAVERAGMACLDQGQRLSYELVRDERIARWRAESLNENICPVGGRPLCQHVRVNGHWRPSRLSARAFLERGGALGRLRSPLPDCDRLTMP